MSLTDNRIAQITGDYFDPEEFGEGRENLDPNGLEMLTLFRVAHGYSTFINPHGGAYRSSGAHSISAFDQFLYTVWKVSQPSPEELWRWGCTFPFWGFGLYFDTHAFGRKALMIHGDWCKPDQRDRPLRWLRIDHEYWYQDVATGLFYNDEDSISLENAIKDFTNQ